MLGEVLSVALANLAKPSNLCVPGMVMGIYWQATSSAALSIDTTVPGILSGERNLG